MNLALAESYLGDDLGALATARAAELSETTLAEGESLDDLRTAKYDPDALAERGLGFERLDQLAMEHLLGVR
jgi:xylose isomerase